MADEKNIVEEQKGRPNGIPTLNSDGDVCCPTTNLMGIRGFNLSRIMPATEGYTIELGNFFKGSSAHTLMIGATVCSANFAVSKIFLIAAGYNETGGNWREVTCLKSSGDFAENDFALDLKVQSNYCYLRLRRIGGEQIGTVKVKIMDLGYGDAIWTETTEIGSDTPPSFFQGTLLEARDGVVYAFGDVDMQGRDISNVPNLQLISAKDQANGYAGLGADSKINSAQLPAIAITDTFTAANEAEQLALTVQKGDVCVRTDEGKTYINKTGDNTSMEDWEYLQSPTDAVQSVDGRTGVITLSDLYEPLDATIMKEGENVGLLENDADYQSGADVDAKIALVHVPWILEVFGSSGVLFPNNDTGWVHIGGDGAITGTEALAQIRMPKGKAIAIQGRCTGGSAVLTIRKNGVNTGITGTIDSVGQFNVTGGGAVDFADGDLLSLAYDTGVGFTVYGIQIKFNSEVV